MARSASRDASACLGATQVSVRLAFEHIVEGYQNLADTNAGRFRRPRGHIILNTDKGRVTHSLNRWSYHFSSRPTLHREESTPRLRTTPLECGESRERSGTASCGLCYDLHGTRQLNLLTLGQYGENPRAVCTSLDATNRSGKAYGR